MTGRLVSGIGLHETAEKDASLLASSDHPRRRAALCVVVALMLSACGSTAQSLNLTDVSRDGLSSDQDGLTLSEDYSPSPGGEAKVEATDPSLAEGIKPAPEDAAVPSRRGISDPASPVSSRSVAPLPDNVRGRGFTADKLYIGFSIVSDYDKYAQSFGGNVATGDKSAQMSAVVKGINASGGIAGRQIVPVPYDFETARLAENPDQAYQQACTYWTEDRPVFAVIHTLALPSGEDTLTACLAKRQTVEIVTNPGVLRPNSLLSRYAPHLYAPNQASLERLVPVWIQRLSAIGYFESWDANLGRPGTAPPKVGIISIGRQHGADFTRALRQELTRRGQTVAAAFESSGRAESMSGEMSSAVLQFRDAGVTHVLAQHVLPWFTIAAASQSYRPRYGLTSVNEPRLLQDNAPAGQLAGALGVSFTPTRDVDKQRDVGDLSAAGTRCREAMRRGGQDTSNSSKAYFLMMITCEGFYFLAESTSRNGLSPAGVQQGAQANGSFPPVSTFSIEFLGGRADGASAVRDLAFRDDCKCFAYLTATNHKM